jgi:hypothetical protein
MSNVWIEFFDTLWNLIKIILSLVVLLLNPLLLIMKFIALNLMNFISLLISNFIYLGYLFGMLIKSLSEYLKFIPLIFENIIKYFYIIQDYIIYIIAFVYAMFEWWFGFVENGAEEEFF